MEARISYSSVIAMEQLKPRLKRINLKWIDFLVICGFYELEKNQKHKNVLLNAQSVSTLIQKDLVYVYRSIKELLEREYLISDSPQNPWKSRTLILSGKGRALLNYINIGEPIDFVYDKLVDDPLVRKIRKELDHV